MNRIKVLVTRPASQSAAFGAALRLAGLEPVFFPVIEIQPVEDIEPLADALTQIDRYAWVIFTSVNGVEVVFDLLTGRLNAHAAKVQNALGERRVRAAAIGPKTAQALRSRGVDPVFVPEEYVAEALLPGLGDLRGRSVLLPRAEIARKALPEAIRAAGGQADEIHVYRTLPASPDPAGLAAIKTGVDWIAFTSPSTVQNFIQILREFEIDPFALPGKPHIACIGPITQAAAVEAGFTVDALAAEYTSEGLVQAIAARRQTIQKE